MQPSSILCRTQEAFHRDRAEGAPLENVRLVAAAAAAAWAIEASQAERREARGLRTRAIAELHDVQKLEAAGEAERGIGEDPDRGFEHS
jgi:hypothetical protein